MYRFKEKRLLLEDLNCWHLATTKAFGGLLPTQDNANSKLKWNAFRRNNQRANIADHYVLYNKLRKAEIMIMFKIRILVQPCFWVLAIIEQFVSESTDTQYYNKCVYERMKYLFIYNWIQTACGQWKTSWHAVDRKTWGMMMRNGNCCFVDTIGATGVKRHIWTAGISFFSSLAWLLHIMPSPRQLSIYSANIWT